MGKLGPRGGWGEAGHWVQPRGCGKTRGIRTCCVSCRRITKMGQGHANGGWGLFMYTWWSYCSGRSLAWASWGHAGDGARQGIGYSRVGAGRRGGSEPAV